MQKKWLIRSNNANKVSYLASAANITELTAKILIHRGISNPADANSFLYPESAQQFYNPFHLKGMYIAVNRIISAINNNELICIFGDYDVDGMSELSN